MHSGLSPHAWTDRISSPLIKVCDSQVECANVAAQSMFHSRHCKDILDALFLKEKLMPAFISSSKHNSPAVLCTEIENKCFLVTVWPGGTPDTYFLLFDLTDPSPLNQQEKGDMPVSFMSALGNELRTPLSIVLPTLDLLAASLPEENKKLQGHLSSLRHYSFKMLRRVRNLTDLPLLLQGKTKLLIKPLDIVSFLRQITEDVRPYGLAEKTTLQFSTEIDSMLIFFDADNLGRALLNIFAFSLKRLPDEGEILLSLKDDDSHIFISIQDTGSPISEKDMITALDFSRQINCDASSLPNRSMGLELELCVARAIVALHNGSLLLIGYEQQGVSVTISLPKQEPDGPLMLKSPALDSWGGFAPQMVELSDAVSTGISPYTFPKSRPNNTEV